MAYGLALAALGCAHYVPVRPEPREAGGVRGEVVSVFGEFVTDFVVRLTPASTVPVGQFRLASSSAVPCSSGEPLKLMMAPDLAGLTLTKETELKFDASTGPGHARMAAGDAVIDIQIGDAAASCLRLPVSGESNEPRWVSPRRWSFATNASFGWNYTLSRDAIPLVAGLTMQRRVGPVRVGGRADLGGGSGIAAGIGPAAGMRARIGPGWGVAGELAYEVAGVEHVGFAHGPRASLTLMLMTPRVPGFEPGPFFGKGLEIFGGYWFAPDRPSASVAWYAGAGLLTVFGP
jgi:hypothetical protein